MVQVIRVKDANSCTTSVFASSDFENDDNGDDDDGGDDDDDDDERDGFMPNKTEVRREQFYKCMTMGLPFISFHDVITDVKNTFTIRMNCLLSSKYVNQRFGGDRDQPLPTL